MKGNNLQCKLGSVSGLALTVISDSADSESVFSGFSIMAALSLRDLSRLRCMLLKVNSSVCKR